MNEYQDPGGTCDALTLLPSDSRAFFILSGLDEVVTSSNIIYVSQ